MKLKLKLMNAERYACPAFGAEVVLKGQTVEVEDTLAKELLKEVRVDALNNEHPMWKKVRDEDTEAEDAAEDDGEGDGEGDEDEGDEGKAPAAKPTRAARTATAAKKKSG